MPIIGAVGECPHCGKKRFPSRKTAKLAARQRPWLGRVSVYQCGDYWHIGHLGTQIRRGHVTRAVYEAGYGSPSRVYEDGAARLGMAPLAYRRGGEGMEIRWSLVDTALGLALVAVTERGVCSVSLGEDAQALEAQLRAEFPRARLQRVDAGRDEFLAPRVRAVADALVQRRATVPVELVGTAFQQRVWQALMRIPPGQTRSYAEIAAELGQPRAVRAVARACASNRVAVLVPCHRVIRGDGSLGGYRWGLPRKRELLARESGQATTREGAARPA